jgi:hypothetical protein
MYKEEIVSSFTVISTSNGYMVEYQTEKGDDQYVHSPNGDNTFDTYAQAVVVLTQHLLKEIL